MEGVQKMHRRYAEVLSCVVGAWKGHQWCMKGFLRGGGDKKSGLYVNEVVISVMSLPVWWGLLANQKSLRVCGVCACKRCADRHRRCAEGAWKGLFTIGCP